MSGSYYLKYNKVPFNIICYSIKILFLELPSNIISLLIVPTGSIRFDRVKGSKHSSNSHINVLITNLSIFN